MYWFFVVLGLFSFALCPGKNAILLVLMYAMFDPVLFPVLVPLLLLGLLDPVLVLLLLGFLVAIMFHPFKKLFSSCNFFVDSRQLFVNLRRAGVRRLRALAAALAAAWRRGRAFHIVPALRARRRLLGAARSRVVASGACCPGGAAVSPCAARSPAS